MKNTFARIKARQWRGALWVQFIMNIGIITANVALFYDWIEQFGISLRMALFVAVVAYLIGTVVIGYIDEVHGVWQQEQEYIASLNPFWCNIRDGIGQLNDKLK
jgi:hypothetical protein